MKLLKKALLLFVLMNLKNGYSAEIKCPDGSMLVDLVISYSQERMLVCQKSINGKFVKDGPEIIYHKDGSIKSQHFYKLDALADSTENEVNPANTDKIVKKSTDKIELDNIFSTMFSNLVGIFARKKIDIETDSELCHENGIDRFNFVVKDTPYTNIIKFTPKCFFEGSIRHEFNKNLSANLKLKNLFEYTQMNFNYSISKKMAGDSFLINVEISNGLLTDLKNKTVKFTSAISLKVPAQKILLTMGKSGVNIEKSVFDVQEINGSPINYHLEL